MQQNISSLMNSGIPGLSNMIPTGASKYDLLDPGVINKNNQEIGDKIVEIIKRKYFDSKKLPSVSADYAKDIKAQLLNDLISLYYGNGRIEKNVNPDMKQSICKKWYAALRKRTRPIIKDMVMLLKNYDKIQKTTFGGGFDIPNLSDKLKQNLQGNIGGTASPGQSGENDHYYDEFIKYKSELFAYETIKEPSSSSSATYNQVTKLHQKIVEQVITNYAIIDRNELVEKLHKIILGENAAKSISNYKKNKNWLGVSPSADNIYGTFIQKLETLSSTKDESKDQLKVNSQVPNQDDGQNGGGKEEIPKYIPSTYNWDKIREYVDSKIQVLIKGNVELKAGMIKDAFKSVFRQANCDSLELIEKNSIMKGFLQTEFESILKTLCENIPNSLAEKILCNYAERNFDNFSEFLGLTVFSLKSETWDLVKNSISLFNGPYVTSFLSNKENSTPELPNLDMSVEQPPDADENECCQKRIEDAELVIENEQNESLEIIKGTPPDTDLKRMFEYINSSPYINISVFNVFKQQYISSAEDNEFLRVLFGMYSSRTVKFMRFIQLQFTLDTVDTYIERYILFKHPHTTKIITRCIKHAADIKSKLEQKQKKQEQEQEQSIVTQISQYATFLINQASTPSFELSKNSQYPFIDFIKKSSTSFNSIVINQIISNMFDGKLIDKTYTDLNYNNDLQSIFSVNNASSSRKTRKILPTI